jgi:hypothetical protein
MNLHAPNIIAASTQHVLHRNYESRGVLKLEEVGAWKYAANPRTEILCCAYAVDNDPVKLWLPSDPPPPEFFEAAQNSDWETAAYDAQFEARYERHAMSEAKTTTPLGLNAVGKARSASYSADYKLKGAPTSIARLRKPYGPSMKFVGEQRCEMQRRCMRRPRPAPLLDWLANGHKHGSDTWRRSRHSRRMRHCGGP